MNVDQLRTDTPGCQHHIHLNNAGSSLMPAPVVRAIQAHLALEAQLGGYEAAARRTEQIRQAYESVARLVGARPEQIAFTESATAGYVQALSSIPFEPGDVVLTTRNDYVSNQIQFLSMQERLRIRLVRAPDLPEGGVDPEAAADLIRSLKPKVVCVTHVPTNSGLVQDVAAIGRTCRAENALYLVDACQSVGQMPVDVADLCCDFLSATFRKFLRGPRGAGFLFVSDRVLELGLHPLFVDLRGAEWVSDDEYRLAPDAKRFETWEFAWALFLGGGAAAKYATGVGQEAIASRVRLLSERARSRLSAFDRVRVLDRGTSLCGIVSIAIDGSEAPIVARELHRRGIFAGSQLRAVAPLDYDDKGITSSLRLSPHYYNTEAEVDLAVDAIAELARETG